NINLNLQNKDGNTILHLATYNINHYIIGQLLTKKLDLSLQNNDGNTILHLVILTCKHDLKLIDIVFKYKCKCKCNLNMKNKDEKTIYDLMKNNGLLKILKILQILNI